MPNLPASNNPYSNLSESKAPVKKKLSFIPLAIILLGIGIFMLFSALAPIPEKKPIVAKAPVVEVVEVERGNVVFEIETQGSILPRTETTLVSEVSGVIKSVSPNFLTGGFFKRGELLLEIDAINYEVALLQAQARLEGAEAKLVEEKARGQQAEKEWSLTGRDYKTAPILALRKPQLQQAEADVKAAQADLRSAQIKLSRTKIVAPYDAMVKAKLVDVGQYVSTGSQLVTTFAVDYAEIRLPIKEQDFSYLNVPALGSINQKGARVEITAFTGGKMYSWDTYVTRSEGVVDAASRVSYVIAQIDDPYRLLKTTPEGSVKRRSIPMGTFVKAKIYSEVIPDVITIPRKAMRGANNLYVVDDARKLKIVSINILRSNDNYVYATDGVESGESVVITKLSTAVNGMSVRLPGDKPEAIEKTEDELVLVDKNSDKLSANKKETKNAKVSEKREL